MKINCGGPDVGDFKADNSFRGGGTASGNVPVGTDLKNADCRYGQDFSYVGMLDAGKTSTHVKCGFYGAWGDVPGKRPFRVLLNGVDHWGTFEVPNGTEVVQDADVAAPDGVVTIEFIGTPGAIDPNAYVSWIDFDSQSAPPPPLPPPDDKDKQIAALKTQVADLTTNLAAITTKFTNLANAVRALQPLTI